MRETIALLGWLNGDLTLTATGASLPTGRAGWNQPVALFESVDEYC